MQQRGWDWVDVVLVTGDAYVDHPAFGTAVIGRVLENAGFRVGVIAMPDWRNPDCMTVFGKPRLFFGIGSGNVDSMLSKYTAFLRLRRDDPYVPGGRAGIKPDRALIVYANLVKSAFRDARIVLGGIEASMRRVVHYDFWSDSVRRSILADTRGDILAYGMAEKTVVAIADRLRDGKTPEGIPGTVHFRKEPVPEAVHLPGEEEAVASRDSFVEFYRRFYTHQHELLCQPAGGRFLLHHPVDT
ncbi:YgiQ family radical SAM protein, partial [bacterium]|nr:YgiQ family radical SAM protein [bacterium]